MTMNSHGAAQFCIECGVRFTEQGAFCANCGMRRSEGAVNGFDRTQLLDSDQIAEIAGLLEESDLDATFTLSFSMFLFIQGRWQNGVFDEMFMELTNPDHIDVASRLVSQGWEVFDPGEDFDKSFEKVFDCPDSASLQITLGECLEGLALTSANQRELKTLTLEFRRNGQLVKNKYKVTR